MYDETANRLWDHEEPIVDLEDVDGDRPFAGDAVPYWIEQGITPSTVAAIAQGGCASGAYMPAVTYHDAAQTMAEHGDDVLQYLQDHLGELPKPADDTSWSQLACFYLSCAVELWASGMVDPLDDFLADLEESE